MVQPILGLVHRMTGTYIQHSAILHHPQASGIKGIDGVGTVKTGAVFFHPILGIADHTNDFFGVIFTGVSLAEYKEVIILSRIKAAEQRKIHGDGFLIRQLFLAVVRFHGNPISGIFHTGHSPVPIVNQIRIHRGCPAADIGVIMRSGICCFYGRRRHCLVWRHRRHDQNRQAGQGFCSPFSHTLLYLLDLSAV